MYDLAKYQDPATNATNTTGPIDNTTTPVTQPTGYCDWEPTTQTSAAGSAAATTAADATTTAGVTVGTTSAEMTALGSTAGVPSADTFTATANPCKMM